ncbi:MAG: peptide-methionine (S)-S-oxide reductase MsrA [Pseudomonadota bacterium]
MTRDLLLPAVLSAALIAAVLLAFQTGLIGGLRANATEPSSAVKANEEWKDAATSPAIAVFAGGCFWCVEADFDKVEGVLETVSGYTGGDLENPTYKRVSYEETGHYEAVAIRFDPAVVSYETLVEYFFRHVDPTDAGGQFCDRGSSYRTAIFVNSPEQKAVADAGKTSAQAALGQEIVTPVLNIKAFWRAEDYHQDYYLKNRLRYRYYRAACGRDRRVQQLWGEKSS